MPTASPFTLLAESYVHTLDPFVLRFTDTFGIRWYGIAYLCGFVAAWVLAGWMARTRRILVPPDRVGDVMTALVIGVLVGGRLGHVIFYDQALLWSFEWSPPFWGVLAIHRGGMASHGGIIGVIVACIWSAHRLRLPPLHLLDLAAFIAPIGLGFGRVANFINGELWGRPLPLAMTGDPPWWSMKYPEEILLPGYPVQALEPLRHLVDPAKPFPRSLYDAAYAGRVEVVERLAPLLTPHYPSQVFQAVTDGVLLMLLLIVVWWRPRRPGVVAAWFLMGYGALRMLTEQFRMPDVGVFTIGWLTLPMLLSLGMIVAGGALLAFAMRGEGSRVGGLAPRRAAE
ncbi:MAG: prolipoprotein diacylglyceryl transferase [Phycisphaerales bacterium]|nr:prolipoprotein diacylglyceryl transferase [Phycisphaerales bacterium]